MRVLKANTIYNLSEISDEEVDYGSYASNDDLDIAPGSWSPI
jgi:hypothetical protein